MLTVSYSKIHREKHLHVCDQRLQAKLFTGFRNYSYWHGDTFAPLYHFHTFKWGSLKMCIQRHFKISVKMLSTRQTHKLKQDSFYFVTD